MAVGLDLDAIQSGSLHALRRRSIVGDDALDIPVLDHLGECTVRRFAHRRGCQHRQPVGLVPGGAPPEVRELNHHGCAMRVAVVRQSAHPGHDLVLVGEQVAENRRRVR
jgi:hypothetical protein